MKIIELKAENIKKLKVVEISPDGSMIVIGGKNAAGKSSVLDAILVALAGKKKIPPKMLREGTKKGFVELDLGDIVVRRTFTDSGGGSLKIENNDGAVFQSPQKMLDKLVGTISFDPLEFTRLDSKKQVEILKDITGLDFSKLDAERAALYEQRTEVNRNGKQLKAQCDALEQSLPDDIPEEKVSVVDLMKELEAAQAANEDNNCTMVEFDGVCSEVEELANECKRLKKEFAETKKLLEKARAKQKDLQVKVNKIEDVDTDVIKSKLGLVEENNKKVDTNIAYNTHLADLDEHRETHREITQKINEIDDEKKRLLEESKLPVADLEFSDVGVLLNGLPFKQASSSEQLKVSVAIGLAMNPRLKVLLIKDGSLLDEDNLKVLGRMAEKVDAQIWLERVSEGSEVSVIMEDGCVRK